MRHTAKPVTPGNIINKQNKLFSPTFFFPLVAFGNSRELFLKNLFPSYYS